MLDDTIAAIATPPGEGGIGIVRVSGPEAPAILAALFRPARPWRRRIGGMERPLGPRSHHLYYGHLVDPASGEVVDEVMAVLMRAPRSYTRQDTVEVSCHGGAATLQRALELVLRHGARPAGPGEFTLRAFANGRIDLAQAEAVLDVIRARTEAGLRVALDQLGGRLSAEVRAARREVLDVLAYLTALIDFAEEDIPAQDVAGPLARARARVAELLAGADAGMLVRHGARAALVGLPNAGKSSLLNALLRHARAIVTPIPGTTRDTLEESFYLRPPAGAGQPSAPIPGLQVVLVDTAGIRAGTDDLVERLGIERSQAALRAADVALFVVDGSRPLDPDNAAIADRLAGRPTILVRHKRDLPPAVTDDELARLAPGAPIVASSAVEPEGTAELEAALWEGLTAGLVVSDAPLVTNPRHKAALARALGALDAARATQQAGLPADFVTIDLRAALDALGEITGESVGDDLLEAIFSRFCIGK